MDRLSVFFLYTFICSVRSVQKNTILPGFQYGITMSYKFFLFYRKITTTMHMQFEKIFFFFFAMQTRTAVF